MSKINKLCLIVLLFVSTYCHAQSYGLQFAGNEVTPDFRTGLDLGSGSAICLGKNFTLSFDLCLLPGRIEYFGYILRLIDDKNNNVDLIYDTDVPVKRQIVVVNGDHATDFPDSIEQSAPYSKWTKFVLKYTHESKMLAITIGNKHFKQKVNFSSTCLRMLFGANGYQEFKTIDVPAMKIRDVRITENDKLSYYWPLNDVAGNKALESQQGKNATVINPGWAKRAHCEWSRLSKFDAKGRVSVAFDPEQDFIYLIGTDSLFTLSVNSRLLTAVPYSSGPTVLLKGNQAYYAKETHRLYNLHIDQGIISTYNKLQRSWDKGPPPNDGNINYWHYNKLWAPPENAFYIFNGYGHFKYKNTVRRFDVASGAIQTIKSAGDYLAPRYLAGLGPATGGAYLIGGYGSLSGAQIANPKNFYDLFYFNLKNRSFKKIYNLKETPEDFVFSNSLVIDEPSHSFYALIFPRNKYNSQLRLIRGSLLKPEIKYLGNNIPFTFRDNVSFSDLFYSPRTKKFIAVTLWAKKNDITEIAVYSLDSPPLPEQVTAFTQAVSFWKHWYLWIILVVACLIVFMLIRHKKKENKISGIIKSSDAQLAKPLQPHTTSENMQVRDATAIETAPDTKMAGSIYLFGDLEVFDSDGIDITKYFTPLVKELFLAVLLYTLRGKRGISSDELTELLWLDKSTESARNNRSVNIAKLKAILDRMHFCQLSKETGNWRVNIDYEKIRVDYYDYLNIIQDKHKLDKQKIRELAEIIKRGSFLKKLDYEWLDTFKSEISNEVIDTYLHFTKLTPVAEDPEFLIRVAGYVFYFDPVNEEAMIIKCKALAHLGKHSLAKATFASFCKEYKAIYGKDFPQDFNSVLEQSFP